MSNIMHELPHGSNTPKKRSKWDLGLFLTLVPMGLLLPTRTVQVLYLIASALFFARNFSGSIEPKTEIRYIAIDKGYENTAFKNTPIYSLSKPEILALLSERKD